MQEVFVDTGAWFAAFIQEDRDHSAALSWLDSSSEQLLTTDYIVDEVLTLLRVRNHRSSALLIGEKLLSGNLARIELITSKDFSCAWKILKNYSDKNWSFTDCTSKAVIERLKIKKAFAFDEHFAQFGNVEVVP